MSQVSAVDATLGDRLRIARTLRRIEQDDIAGKVGVTQATISNWERDRTTPNAFQLGVMARFYRVSVRWFLSSDPIIPGEV